MPIIIAETGEILVINKPAGLIVHSDGRTEESSVADWVLKEYPALASVGESWTSPQGEVIALPGIVHRLDRTTSGIMLIAKTQDMYAYLKGQFKARRVEKMYRAFVYGHLETDRGEIVSEIARTATVPRRWYAKPRHKGHVRAAISEWTLLRHLADPATGELASYVEIRPKAGRTHQIRVHFSSINHPIVADHLYAPSMRSVFGFCRPALHAQSISVVLNGKKQTFTVPLPEDFNQALIC